MRTGTLETVVTIICFTALTAYFRVWYPIVPMFALILLFMGFGYGGDQK